MVSWCSLERDLQMLIPGGGKGEKGRKRRKKEKKREEKGEERKEERAERAKRCAFGEKCEHVFIVCAHHSMRWILAACLSK